MDDAASLRNIEEEVKKLCEKLLAIAEKVVLYVNDEKRNIWSYEKYQQGQFMNVEGYIFKMVIHFKYLVHFLLQDNDLKMEISFRI